MTREGLQVSATRYPPTNMLPNLIAETGLTASELAANVGEVDVMLSTMEAEVVVEDWAMSTSALFNSLGGSLGSP